MTQFKEALQWLDTEPNAPKHYTKNGNEVNRKTIRLALRIADYLKNGEPSHLMTTAALEAYVPQPDAPEVPIFDILDCQPNLSLRIVRTILNSAHKAMFKEIEEKE